MPESGGGYPGAYGYPGDKGFNQWDYFNGTSGLPVPSNKYAYPNADSYKAFVNRTRGMTGAGVTDIRGLRHGLIFKLNRKPILTPGGGGQYQSYTIDMSAAKAFQFNPVKMELAFQAVNTMPEGTEAESGNPIPTIGQAATALELLFIREQEVYAAAQGRIILDGAAVDAYGRLGVQQDVYELMTLLMSQYTSPSGQQVVDEAVFTQDGSMRNLTSKMMDLALAGKALVAANIGISLNDDFVMYGTLTGLSLSYVKWSADLVPTWAYVSLTVDIFNIANVRAVLDAQPVAQGASGGQYATGGVGAFAIPEYPAMTRTPTGGVGAFAIPDYGKAPPSPPMGADV